MASLKLTPILHPPSSILPIPSLLFSSSNDLLTDAQIAERERLSKYPLGIDYTDWGKIFGLFTVFYLLLTALFSLASMANYAAETNEVGDLGRHDAIPDEDYV